MADNLACQLANDTDGCACCRYAHNNLLEIIDDLNPSKIGGHDFTIAGCAVYIRPAASLMPAAAVFMNEVNAPVLDCSEFNFADVICIIIDS
ncbi:hypothetical protein BGV53_25875 [Burkholderia ubonensis]|nr:hypothetical protein BGV53_25875 [Burkholderia ubonensis]